MCLTYFKLDKMYSTVSAAYQKENKKDEDCPIKDQIELEAFINRACTHGVITRLNKKGFFKFTHDVVRECAYDTLHPKNEKGSMYLFTTIFIS